MSEQRITSRKNPFLQQVKLKEAVSMRESVAGQIAADLFFLVIYILCLMSLARGGFNPFIYFQF